MVYLVEAADHDRSVACKAELDPLLAVKVIPRASVVVQRDKNDHYNCISEEEMRAFRANGHHREWRGPIRSV